MALARTARRCAGKVPDVIVTFGMEQQFRFVSHPGVMAVSKLLEMQNIAKMRANFTPADIEKIAPFDPELARKAQIALDNKLSINFQQLELIEESLPRLMQEREQLSAARSAAAALPVGGPYELPEDVDTSACRPIPGAQDGAGTAFELAQIKYPEAVAERAKQIGK
eukprot:NODE_20170_length_809_cov_9.507331.p1 GENE.NODE_20170_length_809_cov_9.507331~~NODE_20170_length_809_cov_9.507331.p1  ORF type:complete len:184 (-),score=48.68 NODE_20170_length_809_cov_9.507331:257-757(-)